MIFYHISQSHNLRYLEKWDWLKLTNKNEESAQFYLDLINEQLDIKTHLGGDDTRSGIISNELVGEIGHLFPNMSMMQSAIYTAHCLINEHDKVLNHKINSLETQAHYWIKFGKPLYDKQQERLRKKRDKEQTK